MAAKVFKGLTLKEMLELERIACGEGVDADITDEAVVKTLSERSLATVTHRSELCAYMEVTTLGQTLLMEAREEG